MKDVKKKNLNIPTKCKTYKIIKDKEMVKNTSQNWKLLLFF